MTCCLHAGAYAGLSTIAGTGGELAPGWKVKVKTRSSGSSAGTSDAVSLLHCMLSGLSVAIHAPAWYSFLGSMPQYSLQTCIIGLLCSC